LGKCKCKYMDTLIEFQEFVHRYCWTWLGNQYLSEALTLCVHTRPYMCVCVCARLCMFCIEQSELIHNWATSYMLGCFQTHFEIFSYDDKILVWDILPTTYGCILLMLFGIVIDEMRTSRCCLSMRSTRMFWINNL